MKQKKKQNKEIKRDKWEIIADILALFWRYC